MDDKGPEPEEKEGSVGGFTVFVEENSHYMDESARRSCGTYPSFTDAVADAQDIVDRSLSELYQPGMKAEELHRSYEAFGEDVFVVPEEGEDHFSGRDYAQARSEEMCSGTRPIEYAQNEQKKHRRPFHEVLTILREGYRDRTRRKYLVVSCLLLSLWMGLIMAGWMLMLFASAANSGVWRILGLSGVGAMAGLCWYMARRKKSGQLKPKDGALAGVFSFVPLVLILIGIFGGPHPHRMVGFGGILCSILASTVSTHAKKYLRSTSPPTPAPPVS